MNSKYYDTDFLNADVCITKILGIAENYNPSPDWVWQDPQPHQYDSLTYVTSGEALLYINEEPYHVKKNTLIWRKKGDRFHSRGLTKDFRHWIVVFSMSEEEKLHFPFRRIYEITHPQLFSDLFQNLSNTFQNRNFGYRIKAKCILEDIFFQLIPEYFADHKNLSKSYNTIKNALEYMKANYFNSHLSIETIAKQSNLTASRFRSLFKELYGVSPLHHISTIRIEKAKSLLQLTDKSIKDITTEVGFTDIYYFSKLFKKKVGLSPKHYREDNLHP